MQFSGCGIQRFFSFEPGGRMIGMTVGALLFILPGLASAATFYVSTTGDAGMGMGTSESPWKTITQAAAETPAGTAESPNVIMVEAGTYDATINGETFPITFANEYVTLAGNGAGSTVIDPEVNTTDALHIDATGVSVSGFTFQNINDADGIVVTEGGFDIQDNVFSSTVKDGITFQRTETDYSQDISFADMSITNNTFATTQNGVYVYVEIDFNDTSRTASFGNFTISDNTLPLTSGDGIYISSLFDTNDIHGGTVTAGNMTITSNSVTGGDGGIYFFSEAYSMQNSQVTVGNVVITGNTCTDQSSYGIEVDYWNMGYFYGTSAVVFGDLTISGNTVQATDYATYPSTDGILIDDIDYIEYIYDQTTVTTGSINVNNNTIDVDDYGIYIGSDGITEIGEQYENDPVVVTTGLRTISGNTINSKDYYGLYLEIEDVGYYMYASSTIDYGGFTITGNTITAKTDALYFYMYDIGYYLYEESSISLGEVSITGNTLTTNVYGEGMDFYFDYVAYEMNDNTSFTMNPYTVANNTINATGGYGMYIDYYEYDVGSYLEQNASATLPDWTISGNIIDTTGGWDGINFYTYSNPDDNTDSTTVHYGSMLIDNNTFNPDKDGGMNYGVYLYLDDVVENGYVSAAASFGDITITNNTVYSVDTEAIYIGYASVGYAFSGTPTLTMGDIEIGSNTIDIAPTGIDVYMDYLQSEDNADVTIGGLNIHDNTLSNISGSYGIYVYYYNLNLTPAKAKLTIGAPVISGNIISGGAVAETGIGLIVDNSTTGITMGRPSLTGNNIFGFDYGMYLGELPEASLSCNFLENNRMIGMVFDTDGTDFEVHTNSIVNNNVGLAVYKSSIAVVNAEDNWWGDKTGPASCASCNGVDAGTGGTVDYTPWLTYQPDRNRCGMPFPWLMFAPAITGMGR